MNCGETVTINFLYDTHESAWSGKDRERCAGYKLLPHANAIFHTVAQFCSFFCVHVCTPPVSPKILSRSGGVRMSLPTTDLLKPGAYCSTQSKAGKTDKCVLYHSNRLISVLLRSVILFQHNLFILDKK